MERREYIMKILAVGAHPDDIEIRCAGTLAKYYRRGDKITMVVVTDGRVGSNTIPQDKLVKVRRKEAEASAKHINAELIMMGYPDQFLFNTEETRKAMIDVIRKVSPDVILAPSLSDYHSDHVIAGQLCIDARTMAVIKLIKTDFEPCEKTPHLYFVDTAAGLGFTPEEFVDISDTIDVKKQMLLEHRSQVNFMYELRGAEFESMVEVTARYRGLQAGVRYAEGFQICKLQPRVTIKNLLP